MKKLILITIISILILGVGIVLASFQPGQQTWGSTVTLTFTPSNNVYIDYAAGTGGVSYTAGSYHQTGNRTFATSSGDTKIYYKDGTAQAIPAAPASGSASANFSGWTEL